MKTIEIGLAANGPYFCGLMETACSMAMHANPEYQLRFHVLDAGIAAEDRMLVERRIADFHPRCVFEWLPVEEKMFAGLPKWNGGYMVYTRLLLPQLLKDIDWCIYCDCDFTWMRDVAELWEMRDDTFAMLGTRDGTEWTLDIEEKWFKEHGFAFNRDDYFCAGLTFFNLKKFRDDGIAKKCLELLQLHPPFNDQSVLNITCLGRVKLIPQVWQRFTEVVTQEELDAAVVIHHAGEVPWTKMRGLTLLSDTRLIWHCVNARIRGISLWKSLRLHYSAWEIVFRRLLVYVVRCPGLRQMMEFVACLGKHPGVWKFLDMRSRVLHVHLRRI